MLLRVWWSAALAVLACAGEPAGPGYCYLRDGGGPIYGENCVDCRWHHGAVEPGEVLEFRIGFADDPDDVACLEERYRRARVAGDDAFEIVAQPEYGRRNDPLSGYLSVRVRFASTVLGAHTATIRIETTGGTYSYEATVRVVPPLDDPGLCYDGPAQTHGVGACMWGIPREDGACIGQVVPRPDARGNHVDEDCDGIPDVTTNEPFGGGSPSVAFDGERFVMAWSEGFTGNVGVSWLAPDGVSEHVSMLAHGEGDPVVAAAGETIGLLFGSGITSPDAAVWDRDPLDPLRFTTFSRSSAPGDTSVMDRACGHRGLHFDGSRFITVAWLAGAATLIHGELDGSSSTRDVGLAVAGCGLDADWDGTSHGVAFIPREAPQEVVFEHLTDPGRRTIVHTYSRGRPRAPRIAWTGTSWIVATGTSDADFGVEPEPGAWVELAADGTFLRVRENPPCGEADDGCAHCFERPLVGLGGGRFALGCDDAYVIGDAAGAWHQVAVDGTVAAIAPAPDGTIGLGLFRGDLVAGKVRTFFAIGDESGLRLEPVSP